MNNINRIVSIIVFVFWMVSCRSQNILSNITKYEKCVDKFCLLDSDGRYTNIPDAEKYSNIVLANREKQQYLRMTHYPGDPMGVMSVFEIGYLSDLDSCLSYESYDYDGAFLTNNNVSLGELVDNIVKVQGKPARIEEKDGCKIYCYWVDETNSEYVRENNECAYFIDYWIKDRRLVKLRFGFEYP